VSEHELTEKAKFLLYCRIIHHVGVVIVTLGVSYYLNKQQALIIEDVVYKRRKRRQARALDSEDVEPDVDKNKEGVEGVVLVPLSGSLHLPFASSCCLTMPRNRIPNYINEITVVRMVVFGAVLLLSLPASSRLRQSRHPQLFPWRGAVSDRILYLALL
jgi:hypothetical protein